MCVVNLLELTLTQHYQYGENEYNVKFEEGLARKQADFIIGEGSMRNIRLEVMFYRFSGNRLLNTLLFY